MPEEHKINYQQNLNDNYFDDLRRETDEQFEQMKQDEEKKYHEDLKKRKPYTASLKEKIGNAWDSTKKFGKTPERWVKDYRASNKEKARKNSYNEYVRHGANVKDVSDLQDSEEKILDNNISTAEKEKIRMEIEALRRKIKLQTEGRERDEKSLDKMLKLGEKSKKISTKLPKALISNGAAMIGNKGTIGMDFNVIPSHTTMGQSATNYSAPNVTPAYNRRPNVDPVVRFENQMKYQQSQDAIRYMQQKRAAEIAQRERARELQAHMRAEQERAHAMRYRPEARRTNIMSFATPRINNVVRQSPSRFTMPNVTTHVNMNAFKQAAPKARKSSGTSGTSHIVGNINRMFSSGRKKFAGVSTGVKKGGFNFGIKMPNIAGNLKKFTTRKKRTKKGGKK